ncbi:MAG: helix-turn-helix transcriptional regulator [Bacilli bacterium]|nr:helix-turn-helix transcriptional regulator [Bacilli bacterium]
MNYFKDKIKDYRKNNGLTQEDLALLLHVSRQAVSKWETGSSYPNFEIMHDIAKMMNVSLDELISNEEIIYETTQNHHKQKKNNIYIIFLFVGLCLSLFSALFAIFINQDQIDKPIKESNYEVMGLIFTFDEEEPTTQKLLNGEYAGICSHFGGTSNYKYAKSYNSTSFKLSASTYYLSYESTIFFLNNLNVENLNFYEVYYDLKTKEYIFNKVFLTPIFLDEYGNIEFNHSFIGKNTLDNQETNEGVTFEYSFHLKTVKSLIDYTIIEYDKENNVICETKYTSYVNKHILNLQTNYIEIQENYGFEDGISYFGGYIIDYHNLRSNYTYLTKYTNEFGFCNLSMIIKFEKQQ